MFHTLLNLMKMWFFSMYATAFEFNTQVYRPGTLIFPLIAFSPLVFTRNRFVLFFALLAVAGLWLAKGTASPFPSVYEWMYSHLPYFFVFRAPSRYFPLVYTVSLSVLFGFTVAGACSFLEKRGGGFKGVCRALVPLIAAILVFFHSWPLFSRSTVFRTVKDDVLLPSVFVNIPPRYERLNDWFASKEGYFRVHSFTNQAYLNYTWGYSSTDIGTKLLTVPQTVRFPQELTFGAAGFHTLMDSFDKKFWSWDFGRPGKLLGLLSVRYVTVLDDVLRRYLPDTNYYEILAPVLDGRSDFKRAAVMDGALVYENQSALPHIYAVPSAKAVFGGAGALVTLSETDYLDRPALVLMEDPVKELAALPPGSMDEVILVDTNLHDIASSTVDEAHKVRNMEDAGFFAVEANLFTLWAAGAEGTGGVGRARGTGGGGRANGESPGLRTVPGVEVLIDGMAGAAPQAGAALLDQWRQYHFGSGLRWLNLGAWALPAGGHHISIDPPETFDLITVTPRNVLDSRLEALRRAFDDAGLPLTNVISSSPGKNISNNSMLFYFNDEGIELSVRPLRRFTKKKVVGFMEDYRISPGLDSWVLLDESTGKKVRDGVVFYPAVGSNGFKVARRISGPEMIPAFDPEVYPYVDLDFTSTPPDFFDVTVSVGLDVTGNGSADEEIAAGTFSPDNRTGSANLSERLKERFGYPGKSLYDPVWFALHVKKRPGSTTPANLRPHVTVRGIRFYHNVPSLERLLPDAADLKISVDNKTTLLADGKGASSTGLDVDSNQHGGHHSLDIQDLRATDAPDVETSEARTDYLIKISRPGRSSRDNAVIKLPGLEAVKINPTLYTVALKRGGPAARDEKFWLVFNEAFHRGWRAYIRKSGSKDIGKGWFGTISILRDDQEVFELTGHHLLNGYANGWWVDLEKAYEVLSTDKSGEFEIVIEFAPQRRLVTGVLFSMCAVAGVVVMVPLCQAASNRSRPDRKEEEGEG